MIADSAQLVRFPFKRVSYAVSCKIYLCQQKIPLLLLEMKVEWSKGVENKKRGKESECDWKDAVSICYLILT